MDRGTRRLKAFVLEYSKATDTTRPSTRHIWVVSMTFPQCISIMVSSYLGRCPAYHGVICDNTRYFLPAYLNFANLIFCTIKYTDRTSFSDNVALCNDVNHKTFIVYIILRVIYALRMKTTATQNNSQILLYVIHAHTVNITKCIKKMAFSHYLSCLHFRLLQIRDHY